MNMQVPTQLNCREAGLDSESARNVLALRRKYAGMSIQSITQYWWHSGYQKWMRDAGSVLRQINMLSRALRHPQMPFRSRLVAGCAVAYIFSPIQLIPTFIPVIGQLDDLFVLWLGTKLLRKLTPRAVLEECEAQVTSGGSGGSVGSPLRNEPERSQRAHDSLA
jgi:uncharacterized membrane protein YkvA (DUF1232 family)